MDNHNDIAISENISGTFTYGSIRRHLLVMSGSAAVGITVIFLSDLVDVYFLGLLGEVEVASAIGYAGSILYFLFAICIGLSVATGALVSQAFGRGDMHHIKENITGTMISTLIVTVPLTIVCLYFLPELLGALGATNRALELATDYSKVVILSVPLLGILMSAGGVMRARGDAKGAMLLTMIGGLVNVILDPLFIFGFGLGVQGAAIATFFSRIAMTLFAVYVLVYKTNWLITLNLWRQYKLLQLYIKVAFPAVLTNLITPLGLAYVTYMMAQFGDSAVAGSAIIARLQPLVSAGIIALSSVVGPIAGQNYGANKMDRVNLAFKGSVRLLFYYSIIVCVFLWALQEVLVPVFNLSDEANELVYLFCNGVSLLILFQGFTLITNSIFNNLGLAHYATIINILKIILGTIPFVYLGAQIAGPKGILWGVFLGAMFTGIFGVLFMMWCLKKYK